MAGSFNRVILMGNLTRDPEIKTLPSGTQVAEIGLAVNDRIKRGDQWEDYANFFDCTAFGRTAENLGRFFRKGRPILIEGKLRWRSWEDRNTGQKRSKVEVVIDTWNFCDSNTSGGQGGGGYQQSGGYQQQSGGQGGYQQQPAAPAQSAPPPPMPIPEDDIPF